MAKMTEMKPETSMSNATPPSSTAALPKPKKTARTTMSSADFPQFWRYAIGKDFADPSSGEPAQYVPGHPQYRDSGETFKLTFDKSVSSMSLNADSTLLALAVGSAVHVYHLSTRELVKVARGHTNDVGAVAWSPTDPKLFVTSSSKPFHTPDDEDVPNEKSEILFWNLDDIAEAARDGVVGNIAQSVLDTITSDILSYNSTHTSPAGSWKLTEVETARLTKDLTKTLQHSLDLSSRTQESIHGILLKSFDSKPFSPDGKSAIFLPGERGQSNGNHPWPLAVLDVASRTTKLTLEGHTDDITHASYNPAGTLIGTASWDGTFRIFSAVTGETVYVLRSDTEDEETCQNWTAGYSPDGSMFAGTLGIGIFKVWNVESGVEIGNWVFAEKKGHAWCRTLSWSEDSRFLAVSGEALCTIVVVEPKSGDSGEEIQRRHLSLEACVGLDGENGILGGFLETTQIEYGRGKCANKLAYRMASDRGLEVYDYVRNLKWRFAARVDEELKMLDNDGWGIFLWLEEEELIVSIDGKVVRFWSVSE